MTLTFSAKAPPLSVVQVREKLEKIQSLNEQLKQQQEENAKNEALLDAAKVQFQALLNKENECNEGLQILAAAKERNEEEQAQNAAAKAQNAAAQAQNAAAKAQNAVAKAQNAAAQAQIVEAQAQKVAAQAQNQEEKVQNQEEKDEIEAARIQNTKAQAQNKAAKSSNLDALNKAAAIRARLMGLSASRQISVN